LIAPTRGGWARQTADVGGVGPRRFILADQTPVPGPKDYPACRWHMRSFLGGTETCWFCQWPPVCCANWSLPPLIMPRARRPARPSHSVASATSQKSYWILNLAVTSNISTSPNLQRRSWDASNMEPHGLNAWCWPRVPSHDASVLISV